MKQICKKKKSQIQLCYRRKTHPMPCILLTKWLKFCIPTSFKISYNNKTDCSCSQKEHLCLLGYSSKLRYLLPLGCTGLGPVSFYQPAIVNKFTSGPIGDSLSAFSSCSVFFDTFDEDAVLRTTSSEEVSRLDGSF